jgi:hypothetical protein
MSENDNEDVDEAILKAVEVRQFIRRKDLIKLLLKENEKTKSNTTHKNA